MFAHRLNGIFYPPPPHPRHDGFAGPDRPLQHARDPHVKLDPLCPEQLCCVLRVRDPRVGKRDVHPAGEAVLHVPDALSMAAFRW